MEEKNTQNCTEQMLEELIKNLVMGKQSLMNIIPKAKSEKLRDELTEQLDCYGKLCDEAKALLCSIGGDGGKLGAVAFSFGGCADYKGSHGDSSLKYTFI